MTVDEYLWRLEWLTIKRERKFERYMRLSSRASSVPSSADFKEVRTSSRNLHRNEDLILESANALEEYYAADDELTTFRRELLSNLDQLPFRERVALSFMYYYNLDREADERSVGICRAVSCRKKDVPEIISSAKQHLRELLLQQGTEVE